MVSCWAAALGECSATQSGEHLVSAGLFKSTHVEVQGFAWCKNEKKRIGLNSLVANVLCTKHNSALSEVDQAGADAFDVFRKVQYWQNALQRLPPRAQPVKRYRVSGPLLERWFMKTLVNLALAAPSSLRWELGDSPLSAPPEEVLRACYGLGPLTPYLGLYVAAAVGHEGPSDDSVSFAPLIRYETHLCGGVFGFRGYQFLLSLVRSKMPPMSDFVALPGWSHAHLQYRLPHFRFEIANRLTQTLTMEW